jgi:hypothetical protein
VIPSYFCPSHRAPEKTNSRNGNNSRTYKEYDNYLTHGPSDVGKNDYAACCMGNYSYGSSGDMEAFYDSSADMVADGFANLSGTGGPGVVVNVWKYQRNWTGNTCIRDRTVDFASIRDGASNTLVAAEKQHNEANIGGNTTGDNKGFQNGWGWDVVRPGDWMPLPNANYTGRRFGSSHPAGFNAMFGDGAVHLIPYTVHMVAFARMGHRADGGVYTAPW